MKRITVLASVVVAAVLLLACFQPTGAQTAATGTATMLVFDVSVSMEEADSSGVVKLQAAKGAGGDILDIIAAENEADTGAVQKVGIVEFSDEAKVDQPLTNDVNAARNALDTLQTVGATAMPKGLKLALEQLSGAQGKPIVILLSDGQPNVGINNEQDETTVRGQVLDLASQAGNNGICVYTVGLGDPSAGTIDESFLRDVAAKSGCGSYQNAQDAWQLANVYIGLRHSSTGKTILTKSGEIQQNEDVNIGDATVDSNQLMLLFTLNWPGSKLGAVLTDPAGKTVDINYPGAHFTETKTLASVIIQDPQAGQWKAAAKGIDVPEGKTTWNAILSERPNPNPPVVPAKKQTDPIVPPPAGSTGLAIAIVLVAAFGGVIFVIVKTTRRAGVLQTASGAAAPASLIGVGGTMAGRSIPLGNGILIGRAPGCKLQIPDVSVSRHHAQLQFMNGMWYIQDLNSKGGVYVNGRRVQSEALRRGDRIRIGSSEFEFR